MAGLPAGCGRDTPKAAVDNGKPAVPQSPAPPAPSAKAGGATHEVTLEVGGKQVAASDGVENTKRCSYTIK
ncbi:hypothetical protein ACGFYQ_24465 [Streptomyces sp. NPDC048258]|uniref:hypothetical protein n=1 Tax=Streptomyces sp. NPDC048258 TaxID=3365527 RepID=UPI003720BB35